MSVGLRFEKRELRGLRKIERWIDNSGSNGAKCQTEHRVRREPTERCNMDYQPLDL